MLAGVGALAPEGEAVVVPAAAAFRPVRTPWRRARWERYARPRTLRGEAGMPARRWAPVAAATGAALLVLSIWWSRSVALPAALLRAAALPPPVSALASDGPATPDRIPPDAVAAVLGYVTDLRPDDVLVQVRPGVLAKRSNVHGVRVGERVVYYDLFPHQSFGPLRSGRWTEADVVVLARVAAGGDIVVVYVPEVAAADGSPETIR
jgi:hypothetical protein